MSAIGRLGRPIRYRFSCCTFLAVLMVISAGSVHAEEAGAPALSSELDRSMESERSDAKPTMEELREHASTITEILELASDRVERLAADDAGNPALVEAIRHELSLTRRWNSHLSTILLDVAEARRALGERERQAAKEVARMTAVAEEARRELVALKNALQRRSPDSAAHDLEKRSQLQDGRTLVGLADQAPVDDAITDDVLGADGDLQAMRTKLVFVQDAQKSAKRDVDAVRAKIIEALQTLATQHDFLPSGKRGDGAALSSEDITAWAASMATRLDRGTPVQED